MGVTKILLHKSFDDTEEDTVVRRKYPRRQPSHHDKALIVAAAHTAQRSTVVHVDNQSPFMLVRADDENYDNDAVAGWTYSAHPPHSIAPNETVVFASESQSIVAGTDSEVTYCYVSDDLDDRSESSITLHWVNPIFGEAKAEMRHEGGDQQLDIEIAGPTQLPCNDVTFVVRERFLSTDDQTLAHRNDSADQHALVCAVDVSNSGIKSIILCTTVQFQNDTAENLIIEFGNFTHAGDVTGEFTSIGSEIVHSGDTEYMRIEFCTAKYARLRPTNLDGPFDQDGFEWCDDYMELGEHRQHTISCKSQTGVFHCLVSPAIRDPLDARQKWRVQPVRTLVNLLPCPIKAHLYSSDTKGGGQEMFVSTDDDRVNDHVILPGERVPLPTMWPLPHSEEAMNAPKSAWLSVTELGKSRNSVPEDARRICVYVDTSHKQTSSESGVFGKKSKDMPKTADSFPIELDDSSTTERRGHATIGYEESLDSTNRGGSDIILYCSHWIVNKTANSFLVTGTGEHETSEIIIGPRARHTSEVDDFGSVFNMFCVGNAPKPKATMIFKCCADDGGELEEGPAEEQNCLVDLAGQAEIFPMKVGGALTKCSVRVGLADSDFYRTKIIEINPLWVIVNQTSGPLTVVEHIDRPQVVELTKSHRAIGSAADDQYIPFTLNVGESNEVCSAPRSTIEGQEGGNSERPYALRFAQGKDTPIVEESITVKVYEHERRVITKGWSSEQLGDYSMSPLIPLPIAGGDPRHLVMENPGGAGQPVGGQDKNDPPVRQVAIHLDKCIRLQGFDWQWIDTWSVKKDTEHSTTDAKGWEYCDAAALGMKDKDSPDMCRPEEWVGEKCSGSFFRRRCWVRTQRRYLTDEAREAALIESQLNANTSQLTKFCKQLKIWDQIPAAARAKPGILKRRLRAHVEKQTTNMWSTATNLPVSGDTQLSIPTVPKKGQRGMGKVTINVQVTTSAQGTLLIVLTDAKQPHYSLDNRSGIPLQSRIVTRRHKHTWFDVPVSRGGDCTDIWEGDSGAALQLKVRGSEDEGPIAPMSELGELQPWEVVYMTPQGPTVITLIPSVAIQREAKTLIVRRQTAKSGDGSSEIVGQFALDIALAGFGLSVVNREPNELMYMSMSNIRMSQTPVTTLKVNISRLNNVFPSREGSVTEREPKLILRLGSQEHETAPSPNKGGYVTFESEVASFKMVGAFNVLEIICTDTANRVPGPDGKHLEDEVLGRAQINIEKLALDEQAFVLDFFELLHIAEGDDEAGEDVEDLRKKVDPLAAYLKLEMSSTMDAPEIVEFGLGSFQLDNQDAHCEDPVVMAPEATASNEEYVMVRVARCTSLDGLTSQLENVELNMAPTTMCLNWEFLAPLLEFSESLALGGNATFDGEAELRRKLELCSRFDELAATSTAKPTKMYAKRIALSKIKLTATTKMKQLIKQMGDQSGGLYGGPLLNYVFRVIATVGVNLVEIVEAPIILESLELPMRGQDPFTTQQALISSITAHVLHQAVLIGLRVLGSTATIQGGTKLVGSVITGLEELGTGFRGLTDGDVVGVGVGVLGLGKNVAGGGLNAVNSVLGLVGDVAGTNALTRNTVGALIGLAQKGISEVSDAIDGTMIVTRNRATRDFGSDDEILVYSSSITLGNKLLRMLQQKGDIPAWVAERHCLSSVFMLDNEHDRSFVSLVTAGYVLQLVGPTHGHRRPTTDVLDTLKLIANGSTSLSAMNKVYLESGAVCLMRTHACNYARNDQTDTVVEERVHVEDTAKATIKVCAFDAHMLEECFEALTVQLKEVHPMGAWVENRSPVLTVSVLAADNLPRGRHAPKVAFVVQVPGSHKERYISAGQDEDISPTFDEAAHFVMKNYRALAKGQGVTIEIWDRNVLSSDYLVGTATLAAGVGISTLNPLPSHEELAKGAVWSTDGFENFVLENSRHKEVGNVRLSMELKPRRWSWEHKLSLKMGAKAVLAQLRVTRQTKTKTALSAFGALTPEGKAAGNKKEAPVSEPEPELELETSGTVPGVIKSGWLRKHWSGAFFSTHKRWFVLAGNGSLSYSDTEFTEPKGLYESGGFHSVKAYKEVTQLEITCKRNGKDEVLVLEGADPTEALAWKTALADAVAKHDPATPRSAPEPEPEIAPTAADIPSRVAVTIWSGHDMIARDISGVSDPYVELRVISGGTKSTKYTSSVQNDSVDPLWNPPETFHCIDRLGPTETCLVRFEVWDHDAMGRDELLGVASFPLMELKDQPNCTLKTVLELELDGKLVPKKTEHAGQARIMVTVRAFYNEDDSQAKAREHTQMLAAQATERSVRRETAKPTSMTFSSVKDAKSMSTGTKIHLRVLSASNVPTIRDSFQPKPYVSLAFWDERPQRTSVVHGSRSPSWLESEEEQHQFMVPVGAWKSRLHGSVWQRASIPPDVLVATFELPVSDVQLEVSVINIKLSPADETMPMAPGEVPTVKMMCVRTEPSAHERMGEIDDGAKEAAIVAKAVGSQLVLGLKNAVDEMASMNAARAVADLCYETSTDGPLQRKAFVTSGGVEALVAFLHVYPPTSAVGKWVAEALRALAREEPTISPLAYGLDAFTYLEAIVEAGKRRKGGTAAGLEAQKTLAVLQMQRAAGTKTPAVGTTSLSRQKSKRRKVSVFPRPAEVEPATAKVSYVFDVQIGEKILHTVTTRYSSGLAAHVALMNTLAEYGGLHRSQITFSPPLEFPPKYVNVSHSSFDRFGPFVHVFWLASLAFALLGDTLLILGTVLGDVFPSYLTSH